MDPQMVTSTTGSLSSRINWLLKEQAKVREQTGINSNCHGTTIYSLSLDDELIRFYQHLHIVGIDRKTLIALPFEEGPGYIDSLLMEYFLSSPTIIPVDQDQAHQGIISFNRIIKGNPQGLLHTGVYLGNNRMFHQHNYDGEFKLTSIDHYLEEEYGNKKSEIHQCYFKVPQTPSSVA